MALIDAFCAFVNDGPVLFGFFGHGKARDATIRVA
jgi:hypothetical protein